MDSLSLGEFITIYKNTLYELEQGAVIHNDDFDPLYEAFKMLSEEDQRHVTLILINDLKLCSDDPLSKRDLSQLKLLNSTEIIKLKTWMVKVIILTLSFTFIGFVFLVIADLYPDIIEGKLSLVNSILSIF